MARSNVVLPEPMLPNNARYSLRFANNGLWDASKIGSSEPNAAFNTLGQSIQIP
jgi:hypothetical protein